jgi:hypothetical protein
MWCGIVADIIALRMPFGILKCTSKCILLVSVPKQPFHASSIVMHIDGSTSVVKPFREVKTASAFVYREIELT